MNDVLVDNGDTFHWHYGDNTPRKIIDTEANKIIGTFNSISADAFYIVAIDSNLFLYHQKILNSIDNYFFLQEMVVFGSGMKMIFQSFHSISTLSSGLSYV